MPKQLLDFVDALIRSGEIENRAQAIRKAIRRMQEETEIAEIFEASRQAKDGRVFQGDLAKLAKKHGRKRYICIS